MTDADFKCLDPIALLFDKTDPDSFIRSLRKQMRQSLVDQGIENRIRRAVYVIRMSGSFIIAYKNGNSPVLYIGRGNATGRVLGHIGKWIKDVSNFGNDTQVEVRIILPRKRNRPDLYKNVEADLLWDFYEKFGTLPYFNTRYENSFARQVSYNKLQQKRMKVLIGVGSGKRPWWALKPTKANPFLTQYKQGETV